MKRLFSVLLTTLLIVGFYQFIPVKAFSQEDELSPGELPVYSLTELGVNYFGKTESEILNNLGSPNDIIEIERPNRHEEKKVDIWRYLVYDGVTIGVFEYSPEKIIIYEVTITARVFDINGFSVGMDIGEVRYSLGEPTLIERNTYKYLAGDYWGVYFHVNGTIVDSIKFMIFLD